jgi:DNA-binding response OmpR family regulator
MSTSKRILVIDDEPDIRDLIAECLLDAGFNVAKAGGAMTGLDLCERTRFDVIITDIAMPDRDGTSLIIELRRRFPSVKIMAISGAPCTRYVDRLSMATKSGAHMVLSKPFELPELLNGVSRLTEVDPQAAPGV